MKMSIFRVLLLFGSLGLAACNDSPSEPDTDTYARRQASLASEGAERAVIQFVYDMNGAEFSTGCEDGTESETVRARGIIVERLTRTVTPSGVEHYTFNEMPVGLAATGLVSGAEYTYKESSHAVARNSETGMIGSFHATFRLESRELGKRFRFTYRGSYNVDADGNIRVNREKAIAECDA